jgi:hypothetical protein
VAQGHHSTSWCNLGNIAYRLGDRFDQGQAAAVRDNYEAWQQLVQSVGDRLANHDVDLHGPQMHLSPVLHINPQAERFHGEGAYKANGLLGRHYRPPFVVPEQV